MQRKQRFGKKEWTKTKGQDATDVRFYFFFFLAYSPFILTDVENRDGKEKKKKEGTEKHEMTFEKLDTNIFGPGRWKSDVIWHKSKT